jgi:hypothetical protein
MARDSSREEIELAVMTTGMAMVVAGVGTREGERAREGRGGRGTCAVLKLCFNREEARERGTGMKLGSHAINGR